MNDFSTLSFKLTPQQVDVIFAALGELPAKHSLPIIQALQKQIQEQVPANEPVGGTD